MSLNYQHFHIFEMRNNETTPYKFNAKELDSETGLYYYGARYYTPELSVWLSVDPLSDIYPSTSPFMYVRGNPVNLIDPNGMYDDESKAQKARDKAVRKHGAENVGRVYYDNDKNEYGFRISKTGFRTHQGNEIAQDAHASADASTGIFSNKSMKNYDMFGYDAGLNWGKRQAVNFLSTFLTSFNWYYDNLGLGNKSSDSPVSEKLGEFLSMQAAFIFIGGIKMEKGVFNRKYKDNILKEVGKKNYIFKVGKSPNINVVNEKIILEGRGPFKGKTLPTELNASDFLKAK